MSGCHNKGRIPLETAVPWLTSGESREFKQAPGDNGWLKNWRRAHTLKPA